MRKSLRIEYFENGESGTTQCKRKKAVALLGEIDHFPDLVDSTRYRRAGRREIRFPVEF